MAAQEPDWPKATLVEAEFYSGMERKIQSKIMSLPGAWIRRAFSYIGGKANKEYETIASEISDGVEKTCKEYLNNRTQELEKTNQDYESSLEAIAMKIPEKIEENIRKKAENGMRRMGFEEGEETQENKTDYQI